MTEMELQSAVIELAKLTGWMIHHDRPAQRRDGRWYTAIEGDAGFPDLVLVRSPRIIFAELKAERGSLTEPQRDWLGLLDGVAEEAPRMEVHLWRPDDWTTGKILAALRR